MKDKQTANLRGIVVAGDSRQQAEDNYRAVATGASVKAYEDTENSFVILSNADNDLDLMNPISGEMNLSEASGSITDRLEFYTSESKEGSDEPVTEVDAFYTICSDGCGSHLIADDPELMHNCPVCASELADLSEDEIMALSGSEEPENSEQNEDSVESVASDENEEENLDVTASDDSDYEEESEQDAIIAIGSSLDEASARFANLVKGEEANVVLSCNKEDSGLVSTASSQESEFKFSPYTGEEVTKPENIEFNVEASSEKDGELDAHWYVCASDECGTHVVSSSEEPVFCPACASGLIEPEDDELESKSSVTKYTPESEEDEGIESTSKKSKCSDDEEEDEDIDDEDLELEDEDDEEDEELDEDNSISVSSVEEVEEDETVEASAEQEEDKTVEASAEDSKPEENAEEATASSEEESDTEATASVEGEETDGEEVTASESDESGEDIEASASDDSDQEKPELTSVDVNLLSIASADGELEHTSLNVSKIGAINNESMWMAFYNGNPVAVAKASEVDVEDTVFESEVFGNLVAASAKENGVEHALNELGFKPIVASASIENYVSQEIDSQVKAQIESVSSEYQQSSDDYSERFKAALATAASGMNKNFFQDATNPVKGALVSTMSALGIRNPEKIVAQAFAGHNDSYVKNLIDKAQQIMEYDLNVQNQLTEAIAGASKELEVTASDSISMGTPVSNKEVEEPKQPEIEAVASNDTSLSIDTVLSTLGRKR